MKKHMTIVHAKGRGKKKIFMFSSAVFKNTSANVGIKLYNKLPNTIKKLEKIWDFKTRLTCFYCKPLFIQWMNMCC
jgi:hypothetical protein